MIDAHKASVLIFVPVVPRGASDLYIEGLPVCIGYVLSQVGDFKVVLVISGVEFIDLQSKAEGVFVSCSYDLEYFISVLSLILIHAKRIYQDILTIILIEMSKNFSSKTFWLRIDLHSQYLLKVLITGEKLSSTVSSARMV